MRYAMLAVLAGAIWLASARAVDKTAIEAAIDRGVAALKAQQQSDGIWGGPEIGATSLAGLTLLECGVAKDHRSVQSAARAVREAMLTNKQTYSLALAVLFLDRLDDLHDTPLIESMIVRLIAGQRPGGGWTYTCPGLAPDEITRIRDEMAPSRKLRAGRDLGKLPTKGKRTVEHLPRAILDQLTAIDKYVIPDADAGNTPDNSNTQFATLALWVGRRYGLPTQGALLKNAQRFRVTQNSDGGWSYSGLEAVLVTDAAGTPSTAPMTCAGLLGLACGHGAILDVKKSKDSKVEKIDISKDAQLKNGLLAVSTAVGNPIGWNGVGPRPAAIAPASGKAFYYLWSLERVAVVLNLETIARRDWYNWGAEILLASQDAQGQWIGEFSSGGADTCFALLFLKKANLARDLSSGLIGLKSEARVLKGGSGLGKGGLPTGGIGEKAKPGSPSRTGSQVARVPSRSSDDRPVVEKPKPKATNDEERAAVRMGDDLLRARSEERAGVLKKLRDNKGVVYTETLVWAISRLDGNARKETRVALAERFTRLKDTTLREYLKDDEPEIRRAAALAAAARGSKVLVPDLIRGLSDTEELVQRAAYTALKELTGKDFGPKPGAATAQRKEAIAAWLRWWKENARE